MKKSLFYLVAFLMVMVTFSYAQKTLSTDYAYTVSDPYKVFDAKEKLYFTIKEKQKLSKRIDDLDTFLVGIKEEVLRRGISTKI